MKYMNLDQFLKILSELKGFTVDFNKDYITFKYDLKYKDDDDTINRSIRIELDRNGTASVFVADKSYEGNGNTSRDIHIVLRHVIYETALGILEEYYIDPTECDGPKFEEPEKFNEPEPSCPEGFEEPDPGDPFDIFDESIPDDCVGLTNKEIDDVMENGDRKEELPTEDIDREIDADPGHTFGEFLEDLQILINKFKNYAD